MSLKITFVTEHFFPHIGGVEKYFFDIASGLISAGFEVRVVTSNSGGHIGFYEYEGIPCYAYKWFTFADHAVPRAKDLEKHVKWSDIVHTTTYTAGPVANRVAKKFHRPCFIIIHEVLGRKWHWIEKNPFMAFAYRMFELFCIQRNYDYFLCNSFATQRDLEQVVGSKSYLQTIHLSVESDALKNTVADRKVLCSYFDINPDDKIFMYYGRPGQPKGIFVYLKAIKQIVKTRNQLDNVKFIFLLSKKPVGLRRKFEDLISKWNLDKYVTIRDSVPHEKLYSLVKAADYIVVPSITEGFGFTCVESCTLGRPVIHSTAGSLPEVAFGKTRAFANRDSNDLARVISETLDGKPFLQSEEKKFTIEKHLEELISLYELA